MRMTIEDVGAILGLIVAGAILMVGICVGDEALDEAYDLGFDDGVEAGFDDGYEAGYPDGFDDGVTFELTDSYYEGEADGYEAGAYDLGEFVLANFTGSITHEDLKDLIEYFLFFKVP